MISLVYILRLLDLAKPLRVLGVPSAGLLPEINLPRSNADGIIPYISKSFLYAAQIEED